MTLLLTGTFGSFEEIEVAIGWRFKVEAKVSGDPAEAARHVAGRIARPGHRRGAAGTAALTVINEG